MKLKGISNPGLRRLAMFVEAASWETMQKHFVDRTKKHIDLVQKYCKKIVEVWEGFDELIERGEEHDAIKFEEPELEPYIWLTWRYKCEDDDVECNLPEGMEDEIDKATEHHILNNAHHPEYHQDTETGLINKEDRDKPPEKMIDATKMTDLDIGEMVSDWCAMSEERGNTPKEWADKNVNVRWGFSEDQEELIYELLDSIWEDVAK